MVSRWDVLEAYWRATAALAAQFLDTVQARMPFPIRAVQGDGGAEFFAAFEAECQRRGIRLFVLPPKKAPSSMARSNGRSGPIRRSFTR